MLASGDARDSNGIPGYEAARDHIALDMHGLFTTHVDALSHMFVRGEMFGGRPASDVRSDGARSNTVLSMADGVVGRGVLLDVPRALGCGFLDAGEVVTVDDLRAAEEAQGVKVEPGDMLLVAWGREARRRGQEGVRRLLGAPRRVPAVAARARRWRCSAATGSRTPCPSWARREWPFPVHQIGITAMGLHLIDNMALAQLSERCAAAGRWEFLFTMGPLRIAKGTGCPVNPVAVL